MAVFRVERNTGYTVMSNHHLRNKELSLKAKGLLSQMLSLPEDWDYTLSGLSYINRESIDAIRTAVWELEKAGYITRRQGRDEKGKMTAIEYTIYEQPQPPELDKKKKLLSKKLAKIRGWIQAAATLLTNIHIPNLFKGKIYQGNAKTVCVPGLNCYSCPAATGACPIGAFQAVVGSSKFKFSYYITGFFILLGVTLGRFICGFLCPFGWFQDLLHKIPGKKLSTAKLKPLRYLKYVILIVFVILLPMLITNSIGMGDPFFCKYICPQGVLEGAIPLSIGNAAIRSALGKLFSFKCMILIAVIVLSILFYRPFCKWICPLGAIYSLFNKVSLLKITVDSSKCVGCGQCSKACKMDVDVCKTPDHPECIRCGACIKACPKDAICYQFMGKSCQKNDNR